MGTLAPSDLILTMIDNTFNYLQRVAEDETAKTSHRLAAIKQQCVYLKLLGKHSASQEQELDEEEPEYPTLSLKASGS